MNASSKGTVELGLGLISIGKTWGVRPVAVPEEEEARALLASAVDAGIRFFDTAPSYGRSELRLGGFLRSLDAACLGQLTVATKCGEHWDAAAGAPYVDHSFDALRRSIDGSLARLPKLDLLQIHKATAAVLRDPGLRLACEYARGCGIAQLGASVTDPDAAAIALRDGLFSTLQFFYNARNPQLEPLFELAARAGARLIVNRPLAMGALAYDAEGRAAADEAVVQAFRFILERPFDGVVLTGTRSREHLRMNLAAFRKAQSASRA